MVNICNKLISPLYIFRGWMLFRLLKSGTVIYNKDNYMCFYIVDENIIVKCGSKILLRISYENMGRIMKIAVK